MTLSESERFTGCLLGVAVEASTFEELGISAWLAAGARACGMTIPTEVQVTWCR